MEKGHPGHYASHISNVTSRHSANCGFANSQSQHSGYGHASENEQFYEAHAY